MFLAFFLYQPASTTLFHRITVICSLITSYLVTTNFKLFVMGRGDIKTKKGKIFSGSFGKVRSAKTRKNTAAKAATAAAPKA
jgi:30S ribosomal protein S31